MPNMDEQNKRNMAHPQNDPFWHLYERTVMAHGVRRDKAKWYAHWAKRCSRQDGGHLRTR